MTESSRVQPRTRRITDVATHDQPFVTPSQFGAYLGVERRQVMKWIEAGSLPAYNFGGRQWRIHLSDAQAFIRKSRFRVGESQP